MPSVSKDQRIATAIAEHHPGELYQRNRGLLKMTHEQLHDFAATKEKGLPKKVKNSKAKPRAGEMRVAKRKRVSRSGRSYDGEKEEDSLQRIRVARER